MPSLPPPSFRTGGAPMREWAQPLPATREPRGPRSSWAGVGGFWGGHGELPRANPEREFTRS
eukprot:6700507-Alexandrium_andersonii.AAC.1